MSDKEPRDANGCFVVCVGLALVILATLHGCAAILRAIF